jgi:hypothetical protein
MLLDRPTWYALVSIRFTTAAAVAFLCPEKESPLTPATISSQDELNVEQLFCATIVSFKRLMEDLAFDDTPGIAQRLSVSRESNVFDDQR